MQKPEFSEACWEDVVGLRTTASVLNVPVKSGPHGELSFFLIKKELFALSKAPCSCRDAERMCF